MKRFYFIILFLPLFIMSCGEDGLGSLNIFPISDDMKLGQQLDAEIKKNPAEYPIYNNSSVQNYLTQILNEVISSPEIKYRSSFNYNLTIIKQDSVINAFATPGGYVYVYTGLLKFAESKAEIAAIIAHEVAHCERRHATTRMTKMYGVSILLDLVLGKNPSQLEQIAANLFTNLGVLKNSRDDEYEADKYAFKYLLSTLYYPGAMTDFFTRIESQGGSSQNSLTVLLSTHPLGEDRVNAVNELIKQNSLPAKSELNMFYNDYVQQVKNKL